MPPTPVTKKYVQRYKVSWESEIQFKDWLRSFPSDSSRGYCLYCKMDIVAHRAGLDAHAKSTKHKRNLNQEKMCLNTHKITEVMRETITEKRKKAELKIAAFVAEHCSLNSVDHLGEVISSLDSNSETLKSLKLHKTKCTGLIVNVLSPCLLEELIKDVESSYFSIIIDESTTVDTKKVMCLIIRYFSKKFGRVHTTFYRLIELEGGTAEIMTNSLIKQLETDGLKLQNLIGIGVDGANVMVGPHNSISARLSSEIPHLVTNKCVCHSFHLAAEAACSVLPVNLDFMVKETHNWFSNSPKRINEYKEIYKLVDDSNKNPKKMLRLAGTRWLARIDSIKIILDQFESLKLHFQMAASKERCFTTRVLYDIYNIQNKLYLTFLRGALGGVTNMNKLFQSEAAEPLKLMRDLNDLLYTNLQLIVIPAHLEKVKRHDLATFKFSDHLMPLSAVYFGYEFNEACTGIDQREILTIKERCRNFLITLCQELQARIPKNIHILEKISAFSIESVTALQKLDISKIAIEFKAVCENIDETLKEWNMLHRFETSAKNTDEFWSAVAKDKDSGGNQRFGHISKLALALLSLPFSNGSVERAFSQMKIIKDKLRNKLMILTVDAILRVRYLLHETCKNFVPTKAMLDRFKTEEVYKGNFDVEAINVLHSSLLYQVEEETNV